MVKPKLVTVHSYFHFYKAPKGCNSIFFSFSLASLLEKKTVYKNWLEFIFFERSNPPSRIRVSETKRYRLLKQVDRKWIKTNARALVWHTKIESARRINERIYKILMGSRADTLSAICRHACYRLPSVCVCMCVYIYVYVLLLLSTAASGIVRRIGRAAIVKRAGLFGAIRQIVRS